MFEEDLVDQKKEEEEAQMVGKIKLKHFNLGQKKRIIGLIDTRNSLIIHV